MLIAGGINVRVRSRWSCNWNQVLNFQHPTSSDSQLTSSIIFNNTPRYVTRGCAKKFVLVSVGVNAELGLMRKLIISGDLMWERRYQHIPVRDSVITMESNQEICIHIICEVYLQKGKKIDYACEEEKISVKKRRKLSIWQLYICDFNYKWSMETTKYSNHYRSHRSLTVDTFSNRIYLLSEGILVYLQVTMTFTFKGYSRGNWL